ncbi:hypothetical protein OUZ56_014810 [Daphnia magna]|uniref:Uncharacterized protein n=1 Tax=Daphnia magna TaxID=35525 RepID=A0ABR0AKX9_9CRUS|nr:hypothetical protein OUZ56_014810 [Daphnia magna]
MAAVTEDKPNHHFISITLSSSLRLRSKRRFAHFPTTHLTKLNRMHNVHLCPAARPYGGDIFSATMTVVVITEGHHNAEKCSPTFSRFTQQQTCSGSRNRMNCSSLCIA